MADITIKNNQGKTAKDLLATKAKQAGQLPKFGAIIEQLNPEQTNAGEETKQSRNPSRTSEE